MKRMEDYVKFFEEVRRQTGIAAMEPDESGLVSVSIDERYNMNLQFVEATGKILCFVEVARLSPETPKGIYRDLLAGGLFGRETAGGYFALEPETESVVYNYYFDFSQAEEDVGRFVETLEKILQLCDVWSSRIVSGEGLEGGGNEVSPPKEQVIAV